MLAQEVTQKFEGKATFVSENFGSSKLAERFGVTRYPAIFVDDVLIARPRDFGFFGEGENSGRYTPWRDAKSHEKFKQDLTRMIGMALAGRKEEIRSERGGDAGSGDIAALPNFALTDLQGKPLTQEEAAGRVVIVEFWATWCPPCRTTLDWLGDVQKKYGNRVAVLALAVESQEKDVREMVSKMSPDVRWAISTPEAARAFGDVVSVPTMFIFNPRGKTIGAFYGAPPDLHEKAEKAIAAGLKE